MQVTNHIIMGLSLDSYYLPLSGPNTDIFHNSRLLPTRCNVSQFTYFRRCSTCFRRLLRTSGAHNCTYSFSYCQSILLLSWTRRNVSSISSMTAASSSIGWQYLKLYVQLCAPDNGWRNRLKHLEHLRK